MSKFKLFLPSVSYVYLSDCCFWHWKLRPNIVAQNHLRLIQGVTLLTLARPVYIRKQHININGDYFHFVSSRTDFVLTNSTSRIGVMCTKSYTDVPACSQHLQKNKLNENHICIWPYTKEMSIFFFIYLKIYATVHIYKQQSRFISQ